MVSWGITPYGFMRMAERIPKSVSPYNKFVAPVFWNSSRILLIDYLVKGQAITKAYYVIFSEILDENIKSNLTPLSRR